MKKIRIAIILLGFLISVNSPINAQIINVNTVNTNELAISIDSGAHEVFGFAYPVTFIVKFAAGHDSLNVCYRYSSANDWDTLPEKTSEDFFNGINAVRFDSTDTTAYISIAFSGNSDSLYLKITNNTQDTIIPTYTGIAKYYDNRKAVVTASADDWSTAFNNRFDRTVYKFRSYQLPITVGIITATVEEDTWKNIQAHLDSGYVEAAAHSRYHPRDATHEVAPSKEDIIENLELPAQYRKGNKEYVYVWIAPYGNYNSNTEKKVWQSNYLIARMYTYDDTAVASWNSNRQMFNTTGSTVELGHLPWQNPSGIDGVEDVDVLNNTFEKVYNSDGVYHLVHHPHVIYNDWMNNTYLDEHLSYISHRKDIWYATLGHLYVYEMMHINPDYIPGLNTSVAYKTLKNKTINLKNYPNPFHYSTTISYNLTVNGPVTLELYNQMGAKIETLVNETQPAGHHSVYYVPKHLSPGIYYYRLSTNESTTTGKFVFIK